MRKSSLISPCGSTSSRLRTTRIMWISATISSRRSRELILPSEQDYPILRLNLLRLLVQNMMEEFHTELLAHHHTCIKHAVELRRLLYNRVLSSRQAVPHETYVYFMDLLAKIVRLRPLEPLTDAKILMFASDQELQAYVWTTIPTWRSVAPEYTSRELRSSHHARRFSHYSSSIKL